MLNETWTRVLATALVLPLAVACADTGEDEFEDMETLETMPTEMNRVELEPFGSADIEGWVTARAEGGEIVLTLNLDDSRTDVSSGDTPGAEGEISTDAEATRPEGEGEQRHSARLVEGMCMDVRPGSQRLGEAAPGETGVEPREEGEEGLDEQESVRTVAEFEEPEQRPGTSARPGMERSGETSPMSARTLEARVSRDETTGPSKSYAVVVEDDDSQQEIGTDAREGADADSDVVACADVTRLIRDAGSPAGTSGQPTGTEGTSGERGSDY